MLTGAGLGNDPSRTHLPGEQGLTDGVVDLVGPGMGEVFAFQPNVASPRFTEAACPGQRRGSSHPARHLPIELGQEARIVEEAERSRLETFQGRHQDLRHVAPAEWPEPPSLIGKDADDCAAHTITSP